MGVIVLDFTYTAWRKSSYSGNGDCIEVGIAAWRKSSYSGSGGQCVETVAPDDTIGIRDSKAPNGGVIVLGRREWARLVGVLKTTGDA
ncbi:hypothetical protein BJF79_18580 [Actinomadura sp. CNU-125]|uniref:DUF397 domain-containing protein n=1 Tax=Actinomadura sp. CNU-125 TaxID=1904961 RepID=UPI00095CEC2F|nr:DUF397 domain-containing protein [Actinomadura sp. CNU-125]OLT16062.1 hypothetical protein BJF79_18580 [Actinomadura sp. CNU-125]